MKTGRPIVTDVQGGARRREVTFGLRYPVSPTGSTFIQPAHRLTVHQHLNIGMTYQAPEPPQLKPGQPSGVPTVKRTTVTDDPNVAAI